MKLSKPALLIGGFLVLVSCLLSWVLIEKKPSITSQDWLEMSFASLKDTLHLQPEQIKRLESVQESALRRIRPLREGLQEMEFADKSKQGEGSPPMTSFPPFKRPLSGLEKNLADERREMMAKIVYILDEDQAKNFRQLQMARLGEEWQKDDLTFKRAIRRASGRGKGGGARGFKLLKSNSGVEEISVERIDSLAQALNLEDDQILEWKNQCRAYHERAEPLKKQIRQLVIPLRSMLNQPKLDVVKSPEFISSIYGVNQAFQSYKDAQHEGDKELREILTPAQYSQLEDLEWTYPNVRYTTASGFGDKKPGQE